MNSAKTRCTWCTDDPLYIAYHDSQWGVPLHDDRLLFEFLILEGAQAGLSWLTILRKRENYRRAFHNFDFRIIADYGKEDIERLLSDSGIIRNARKVNSSVQNAQAVLKIVDEYGSLDAYLWSFVDGATICNSWQSQEEVPVSTKLSQKMSAELKKRGFSFVGPTICYAFMQAVGMVNDHTTDCFRWQELNNKE